MQTRYRHLPVFYTLFYLHSQNGDPIIRPLFYEYPDMMDQDDHLLLGNFMIRRNTSSGHKENMLNEI